MRLTPEQEACEHLWSYTGVRFRDGSHPIPGGSARVRYYGQHYLCTRCALTRIHRLDLDEDTMKPIKFNASPATVAEFPIEHERGYTYGES